MATLVLTGIGTLVGGPIGGAIGAIAGQAIDRRLLRPKGRQGPRLDDLRVQTSRYGTAIPAVHGRMRVAGTVVWSTDLIERRDRQGGGKGRPSVTNHAYSASFAVLLSARPAIRIERIWADGNLLRGVGGDWKQPARMRFHDGRADAGPDPLIASAEGLHAAPAMRGMAYVVFEELDLTPFGNRVPSLTFELVADEGGCGVAEILAHASGGTVRVDGDVRMDGFASGGDSLRGLTEALAPIARLHAEETSDGVRLAMPGARVAMLEADEIRDAEDRIAADDGVGAVALGYLDPARDHQAGLQRARRPGGGSGVMSIELPAALSAEAAKAAAAAMLDRAESGRRRLSARLPFRRMTLRAGQHVGIDGRPGLWRVTTLVVEADAVRVELALDRAGSLPARIASPGRPVREADEPVGETRLMVAELPALDDRPESAPRIVVAAAGTAPGWRRAALVASIDDGARFEPLGGTAAPAVMGTTLSRLGRANARLIDRVNHVDVILLHAAMEPGETDLAGLLGQRSLALIGEEVIGFERAEPIGDARWRLTGLLRGVRGTEWAMADHRAGERFLLLEPDSLRVLDVPASAIGAHVSVIAAGAGDPLAGMRADLAVDGRAMRPPAPVDLAMSRQTDGSAVLTWTRRSRAGWAWRDHADAPLGEASERYRVTLFGPPGGATLFETDVPSLRIGGDAMAGVTHATVEQVGDHGPSRPAGLYLRENGS